MAADLPWRTMSLAYHEIHVTGVTCHEARITQWMPVTRL